MQNTQTFLISNTATRKPLRIYPSASSTPLCIQIPMVYIRNIYDHDSDMALEYNFLMTLNVTNYTANEIKYIFTQSTQTCKIWCFMFFVVVFFSHALKLIATVTDVPILLLKCYPLSLPPPYPRPIVWTRSCKSIHRF